MNRGVANKDGKVYVGTVDGRLVDITLSKQIGEISLKVITCTLTPRPAGSTPVHCNCEAPPSRGPVLHLEPLDPLEFAFVVRDQNQPFRLRVGRDP